MTANVIDPAGTLENVASYLVTNPSGFALTSIELQGTIDAISVFDSVNLSPSINFSRGVLLTNGQNIVPRINTDSGFTGINGQPGNADLSLFASAAFPGDFDTNDATVLTLTFTITDPNVNTLSFSVAYGSDEYPEFSDSFVDLAAVWTGTGANAKNYALVNNNPNTPLAVIGENLSLGNFVDNTDGSLAIEYDGIINKQTILVPVTLGVNVIHIGVADTGDDVLDTGLFVFDITGSGSDVGGTFQNIPVVGGGSYDSGENNDIFEGEAQDFNGTTITNFSDLDQIFINGSFFSDLQALLGVGSLDLRLDTDNDGAIDTVITLEEPLINATVNIVATAEGTAVTLTALEEATDGDDSIDGTDKLDYIGGGLGNDTINGLGGSDALFGDKGGDFLFGGEGADWLTGGEGNDTMTGGEGADIFAFAKADGAGRDRIVDFDFDDVLITDVRIVDRNHDDTIGFGRNNKLDLAGGGLVTITGEAGNSIRQLEYDGLFHDEATGKDYFVYSLVGSAAGLGTLGFVGDIQPV